MGTTANAVHREPWNKGKIVGQKARNASSIHAWMKASGGLDGSGATRIGAPLSMNERQELIELRRKFKQVQAGSAGGRHIGKGYGLVCRKKREDVHVVYELVKANWAELPVRAICTTFGVPHSGYCDWLERPACAQAQANAVLLEQIRQAHLASDTTYGVPRIQA